MLQIEAFQVRRGRTEDKQQLSPAHRHSDSTSSTLVFHNSGAQVSELRLHILHFPSSQAFVLVVFWQTTSLF